MPAEQIIVFVSAIDAGTVVAEQPQIFVTDFIVSKVLQQLTQLQYLCPWLRIHHRMRDNFVVFSHTHRIHDVVTLFGIGIRRDFAKLVIINDTAASALHLRVKHIGLNILHE